MVRKGVSTAGHIANQKRELKYCTQPLRVERLSTVTSLIQENYDCKKLISQVDVLNKGL